MRMSHVVTLEANSVSVRCKLSSIISCSGTDWDAVLLAFDLDLDLRSIVSLLLPLLIDSESS